MNDLRAAAAAWTLDPAVAFLNHGAFGACPRPVLEAQSAWRARMEAEPVLFLDREIDDLMAEARSRVAAFLGADPAGFAFVPNATTAVSTVLASLALTSSDEIVTTDHAYGAVRAAMVRACETSGATLRIAPVPVPLDDPAIVTEAVAAAISEDTRLVIVDHITSTSALVLPIGDIVRTCRDRGVAVMVDAAHAPGMLDVDVDALGADYWCGNLHKWLCAPKGAAVLWAGAPHREGLRPQVTSHDHLTSFHARFDWTGTHDPSPYLSAPSAIDFFGELGWDRVREHNRTLAERGRAIVAASIGAERIAPPEMHHAMSVVPLPARVATTRAEAARMTRRLFEEHRIEVPVSASPAGGLLRLSAHLYNREEQFDRLARALAEIV